MAWTRYRFRRITSAILFAVVFTLFTAPGTGSAWGMQKEWSPTKTVVNHEIHVKNRRSNVCLRHGFDPYPSDTTGPRKIYDLFMLSTELDWLEIRLNTLSPYVDYFVVIESDTTFTGLPKPLFLQENWDKFTKFHDQIIHVVVRDPGPSIGLLTWDHEDYLRNAMLRETVPAIAGTAREMQEGDALIVSDIDEVPKPETLTVLRECNFPDRLTLRSNFYYYSFQWRHVGEQWAHPQATVYHGIGNTILPNDLRHGLGGPSSNAGPLISWWKRRKQSAEMWNAAWHCSSCFSTLNEMLVKMKSFSHPSLNTEDNRNTETMMRRVRSGLDLFGRKHESYERVEQNQDVPSYVLQNPAQYRYLLDRDGADAGFRDWP